MREVQSFESAQKQEIYGSFYLYESEFALAVSHVQEVVNAPESYTSVPLAPPFLRGLFNLRGTVIPVIDLCSLLNMPVRADSEGQKKIAIIELDGSCVGLLFDKTGEVFKSREDERSDFDSTTESGSGVVCGVFKKDSGKRIVQILDVSKLFKLQNVPKDVNSNRQAREGWGRKRGNRKQCISFVVGPAKCSVAISGIQEILKIEKMNESALGVGFCIGTIDLRGSTVPVIDFPALLGYREVDRSKAATQGDRRVVVMKLEQELFGLLVDSVDSIVSYFPDELLTFPLINQGRAGMFLGCITGSGESDILLLDHQKIFDNQEIAEITHGHSKLYQSKAQKDEKEKSAAGARKTYITFKIDGLYAVKINEVKEIIDYPNELLQPPGMKKHMRGLLNLRGHLVTIIDARTMYASASSSDLKETQKVLVFQRADEQFGLVVDSVESIVTFSEKDKIALPKGFYSDTGEGAEADISEAVQVTDTNGNKTSMLILNMEAVAARASGTAAA